jgi:uncharacterized protein (UPF0332 family)
VTGRNRQTAALEHVACAARFQAATEVLAGAGLFDRAASQLYYAVFHMVRALLYTEGLEPKTHKGTQQLLHVHFVKPGLLDKVYLNAFAELQREREESDYMAVPMISKEEYRELRQVGDNLHEALRKLLAVRGVDS